MRYAPADLFALAGLGTIALAFVVVPALDLLVSALRRHWHRRRSAR